MAIHPAIPASPYDELLPAHRWFPADEALRDTAHEKLLPPIVAAIREEVHAWRAGGYVGASETSRALMAHWFETEHLLESADGTASEFQYYFAQCEAVETTIWLYEVRAARDKFDLMRFDASGSISANKFAEDWPRYVLKLATGAGKTKILSLQIDVTATPRHDSGAIFVQTVSDYPLVEAIHQNVVKHPVLPDAASRAKLAEKKSAIFSDRYADYLQLGVEEWHKKLGKKAVLFVMVDDTKNCDDVGEHLQKIAPELEGGVLVIHTKKNGEISEASSGKAKEELELLRKQSNEIDSWESPFKAIVSVLMLKEGWDVKNVTTIVGLCAYVAKSNILPEQTLGRGLRRMYFGTDMCETVSVMGTAAFMEFVESIQNEGVTFEHVPMGAGQERKDSLVVEVDSESDHTIHIDGSGSGDYRSVVAYFARLVLRELRLIDGYDLLYPKVRDFMRGHPASTGHRSFRNPMIG